MKRTNIKRFAIIFVTISFVFSQAVPVGWTGDVSDKLKSEKRISRSVNALENLSSSAQKQTRPPAVMIPTLEFVAGQSPITKINKEEARAEVAALPLAVKPPEKPVVNPEPKSQTPETDKNSPRVGDIQAITHAALAAETPAVQQKVTASSSVPAPGVEISREEMLQAIKNDATLTDSKKEEILAWVRGASEKKKFFKADAAKTEENVYIPGQVTEATYRIYDPNLEMMINREALVYVPSSYDSSVPTPVVLSLHGGMSTADQMMNYTGMNAIAEEEGFIAVYPQGLAHSWNAVIDVPASQYNVDDVGFIEHVIGDLEKQLNIASNQIYATGISNGGQMCYKLAAQSNQIAAIAVVESGIGSPNDYQPLSPVPIMVIHGTADTHIPYGGGPGTGQVSNYSYMSATQLAGYLSEVNHVQDASPAAYVPYAGFVESSEIKSNILSSPGGADLVLITVSGGGHTWPGADSNPVTDQRLGVTTQALDASQAVWNFFDGHPAGTPTTAVATTQGNSQSPPRAGNIQATVTQAVSNGGGGGGGRRGR